MTQQLAFSYRGFGKEQLAVVLMHLVRSNASLELKETKLGGLGLKLLCDHLPLATPSLTVANDTHGGFIDGCESLALMLKQRRQLQVLKLPSMSIGRSFSRELATQLADSSLSALNLSGNQLSTEASDLLCKALISRRQHLGGSSLTTLDLSHNSITTAGAASLADLLCSSSCLLTSLDLSHNQLEFAGVQLLVKRLDKCKHLPLRYLNVAGNVNARDTLLLPRLHREVQPLSQDYATAIRILDWYLVPVLIPIIEDYLHNVEAFSVFIQYGR